MLTRRSALALLSASAVTPTTAFAKTPKEIMWEDLIPEGVPYSEIIGEGELDLGQDTWNPIYDANATKVNDALNNAYIKMPGFIVPFELTSKGVVDFMLVPYFGACIHTPPPPANQLVIAESAVAWPNDKLWDAVWVTGMMQTKLQDTDLGTTGYFLAVDAIEVYEWD